MTALIVALVVTGRLAPDRRGARGLVRPARGRRHRRARDRRRAGGRRRRRQRAARRSRWCCRPSPSLARLLAVAARKALAVRRRRPRAGAEGLIGRIGVVQPRRRVRRGRAVARAPLVGRRGARARRGRAGRRRAGPGPDAVRAPGRGMGGAVMDRPPCCSPSLASWSPSWRSLAAASIRILREYERAVVFRLGRLLGVKGPGLILLIPCGRPDGARGPAHGHARHPAAERDHARQRAGQGQRGLLLPRRRRRRARSSSVEQYLQATTQIAQTTLRSVLGKADLDMLLSEREQLNEALQHIIDEHTDPWGIKVTTVEIKDVEIPTAMQHAMALGAAGRARAAGEDHPRRGRVPGVAAAARRRRRDLRQPGVAAAALPADADRDRRDAELDGRLPAPDGRHQAVRGGASAVGRAQRSSRSDVDGDDLELVVAEPHAPLAGRAPSDRSWPRAGRPGRGRRARSSPSGLSSKPRRPRAGGKS